MTRFLPGLVLALAACTTPASVTPISQSQPVAATYTCRHQAADGTWEPVPLADCAPGAADHRLLAWVANGFTGDVGIIDLTRGKPVDLDVQVPGHTRVRLGVTLSDVTALPTGDVIFATDPVERTLVGMDSLTLEKTVTFDLPGAPLRVLTLPWADPLLWVLVDDPPALVPVDPAEGPLEALALPGSPSDAASAEGSTRLVVAYQRLHRISVVDLSTLTLLPDIGLADACADGLDNDDDGLADAADPHCEGPGDDREAPDDPAPAPTACLDGLDNDDDGLTDVADPGCVGLLDGSEAEDAPAGAPPEGYLPAWELPCADSLDDDGDGLVDGDDPDCLRDPQGPEAGHFACADGLDNDGDGLVDWPEDPACYRASGASEAGLPDAMAHVAVVQGGRFAYVGDVGLGQVLVVDLDEGRRLDLAGADNPAGDPDPVDSARGVRGFPVTASILDLESLRHTDHGDVVLSTSDGRLTVLRALEGDDAVHTLEVLEQDPGDTQALKPRLFDRDEEIELGFTPPPEYPSLGPLAVVALDEEAERSRFYGLLFSERVEWHRTEVWNITWEGPLPEARDLPAVLRTPARLDLPGADLCAAGVEPGDVAVIRFGEPLACGAFEGLEFEYVVEDAGPDWLLLDAEAGGRQIPDLPEGDELEDDEWTPEWPQASLGMPAPECFQGILRVDVRAAGQFVVRGSRTGFLHPVMSAPEGCIMDGDADPLFTGRAVPATVLPEAALTTCPLTDLVEGLEARTFRNHIFEVDIFPPCKVSGDGGVTILDIPRDVRWSVTVSSGFDLKDLLTGGLPLDLELLPGPELLMLLDPTTRALKAVDPEDLVVDHVYL